MNKLISFVVPCYNSAAYMNKCINSILSCEADMEIILVNDGSVDETGTICDDYAKKYPDLIKVIHQENGGHGEGVNQGLKNATGLYFKVVDSDDWLDKDALNILLSTLDKFKDNPIDMFICNYVYEHVHNNISRPINYVNIFPENECFGWNKCNRFKVHQYLLMHSVIYRTEILKNCDLVLPKHTFYVDNIFVFKPLPYIKTMYYLDIDLYRYYIGRPEQSVNQEVMIKRANQQLKITKIMIDSHDMKVIYNESPELGKYMTNYLAMMITITSILLIFRHNKESEQMRKELWAYLKKHNPHVYRKVRYGSLATITTLRGKLGRKIALSAYQYAKRKYNFN